MLPTFLMIGSGRCASTWLYQVLKHHPKIGLTHVKEISFFGKECIEHDLAWYRARLRPVDGKPHRPIRGDVSPLYSRLSVQSIRAVHSTLPEAKIILVIRNPMERAWSHALMDLARLSHRDVRAVGADTFIRCLERSRVTQVSDYEGILDRWLKFYPREAIHVALYDQVEQDPQGFVRGVLRHIGADADWQPPDGLLHQRVWTTHDVTRGQADGMMMPGIVRWYLANRWLEPTRRLNDRLGGQLSSWIEQMEQDAAVPLRVPVSWRIRRALDRTLLAWPERIGYGVYDFLRERRLARAYRRIDVERRQLFATGPTEQSIRDTTFSSSMGYVRRLALAGVISLRLGIILTLIKLAADKARFF